MRWKMTRQGAALDQEPSLMSLIGLSALSPSSSLLSCLHPMRTLGHNAPLIQFLISVLYILFACLYRMHTHLSFFL